VDIIVAPSARTTLSFITSPTLIGVCMGWIGGVYFCYTFGKDDSFLPSLHHHC
jgi:hypothetical protein